MFQGKSLLLTMLATQLILCTLHMIIKCLCIRHHILCVYVCFYAHTIVREECIPGTYRLVMSFTVAMFFSIAHSENSLTIMNYNETLDAGTFVCRASNIAGNDVASAAITSRELFCFVVISGIFSPKKCPA